MEEVVLITVHSIHDVGEIPEDGVGTLDEDLGFGKGPACLLTQFLGNEATGALQRASYSNSAMGHGQGQVHLMLTTLRMGRKTIESE